MLMLTPTGVFFNYAVGLWEVHMDFMPIFAGIVGLVIVVAVAVSAGTMGAIFGVIAEEDEEEDF